MKKGFLKKSHTPFPHILLFLFLWPSFGSITYAADQVGKVIAAVGKASISTLPCVSR